jgi:hypothetical protein
MVNVSKALFPSAFYYISIRHVCSGFTFSPPLPPDSSLLLLRTLGFTIFLSSLFVLFPVYTSPSGYCVIPLIFLLSSHFKGDVVWTILHPARLYLSLSSIATVYFALCFSSCICLFCFIYILCFQSNFSLFSSQLWRITLILIAANISFSLPIILTSSWFLPYSHPFRVVLLIVSFVVIGLFHVLYWPYRIPFHLLKYNHSSESDRFIN